MVEQLLVVNGIPGSGKTTTSRLLAARLGLPLIAKDAIKEALHDTAGAGLPTSALGRIALEALWSVASLHPGTVMIESFWATGRDETFFADGWARLGSPASVELWCTVPLEIAVPRFTTRDRHAAHADAGRVDEMRRLASRARPITGLPVLEIDTGGPVDVDRLATSVTRLLAAPPPAPLG